MIFKDTLRVVFTQGFSSQIWILIKCNVMSKMCSKQKSINEMNYYRQNIDIFTLLWNWAKFGLNFPDFCFLR